MYLTTAQISLIRESYAQVLPEAERVSGLFYQDLFQRDPRVEPLFKSPMSEQGMRFMMALEAIVENLDDQKALDARVDRLASSHAHFHIRPESYREMEESLVDTLAHALGARFTNDVELAWRSAFGQIGKLMIERGKQD